MSALANTRTRDLAKKQLQVADGLNAALIDLAEQVLWNHYSTTLRTYRHKTSTLKNWIVSSSSKPIIKRLNENANLPGLENFIISAADNRADVTLLGQQETTTDTAQTADLKAENLPFPPPASQHYSVPPTTSYGASVLPPPPPMSGFKVVLPHRPATDQLAPSAYNALPPAAPPASQTLPPPTSQTQTFPPSLPPTAPPTHRSWSSRAGPQQAPSYLNVRPPDTEMQEERHSNFMLGDDETTTAMADRGDPLALPPTQMTLVPGLDKFDAPQRAEATDQQRYSHFEALPEHPQQTDSQFAAYRPLQADHPSSYFYAGGGGGGETSSTAAVNVPPFDDLGGESPPLNHQDDQNDLDASRHQSYSQDGNNLLQNAPAPPNQPPVYPPEEAPPYSYDPAYRDGQSQMYRDNRFPNQQHYQADQGLGYHDDQAGYRDSGASIYHDGQGILYHQPCGEPQDGPLPAGKDPQNGSYTREDPSLPQYQIDHHPYQNTDGGPPPNPADQIPSRPTYLDDSQTYGRQEGAAVDSTALGNARQSQYNYEDYYGNSLRIDGREDSGLHAHDHALYAAEGGNYAGDGGSHVGDGGIHAGDGGKYAGDGGVHAEDGGVHAGDGGVHAGDGGKYAGDGGKYAGDGQEALDYDAQAAYELDRHLEYGRLPTYYGHDQPPYGLVPADDRRGEAKESTSRYPAADNASARDARDVQDSCEAPPPNESQYVLGDSDNATGAGGSGGFQIDMNALGFAKPPAPINIPLTPGGVGDLRRGDGGLEGSDEIPRDEKTFSMQRDGEEALMGESSGVGEEASRSRGNLIESMTVNFSEAKNVDGGFIGGDESGGLITSSFEGPSVSTQQSSANAAADALELEEASQALEQFFGTTVEGKATVKCDRGKRKVVDELISMMKEALMKHPDEVKDVSGAFEVFMGHMREREGETRGVYVESQQTLFKLQEEITSLLSSVDDLNTSISSFRLDLEEAQRLVK